MPKRTTPTLRLVKTPQGITSPQPEAPSTACADLYQRIERALYDWQLAHKREIAEGLSVEQYTQTLMAVMAQALVDAISHLEPADQHIHRLYAEQMGSKLTCAILSGIKSQAGASS